MFMCQVHRPDSVFKLSTMVDRYATNPAANNSGVWKRACKHKPHTYFLICVHLFPFFTIPLNFVFRSTPSLPQSSAMWNDQTEILAAISDQKLLVWYYPNVVYVDKDMLESTTMKLDATSFGKVKADQRERWWA